MANASQLQPALTPQVQASSSQAPEKDADFLALRLVNKRARLRLSPEPLDLASFPGKASLFAIVNSKGWFAAVTRDASGASALVLSPLADLRSTLTSASADDELSFKPQRCVPISGAPPHILTFACNGTRVLLGLADGSIHVYASDQLLSSGEGPVQPTHVFTTSSSAVLLSIQPNPGDIPELIAVLRDCTNSPGSLAVELLDVQKLISSGGWMAGKSPSTTPTSISWSPKGKQLALGLQSGDIVTFSPTATATPKFSIPHPPSANNMSVVSVHWLSTASFHTIYAPPGQLTPDVEQIHFHASLDSKSNSAQDIRFNNPYLPFPGLRPPGEFLVCLRGWDPSKVLLFIGDSTSSDIGLIGSVANDSGESWHNFSLEETSTPSLPLDKDQNDTILLGMDVDLTSSESYRHSTASGEALELPAHPIMYVYASDGTILGWHVLNVTGASYPGMVTAVNTSISAPSVPSSMVRELSSDMQTTPSISPTTSATMETSATQAPSAVFGQAPPFGAQSSSFSTSGSAFGQPPTFGQTQSGFGQQPTSVFGKSSTLGQSVTTPVFGSTTTSSIFGQPSTPAFGSAASGGGFGAFSSVGPAKFGQTTFGFGVPPQTTTTTPPPSTSAPEESMASDDAPSFGGFGLGAANSRDSDSRPSIFGNSGVPALSGPQSTDGGLIKPDTGFGAFAGFDQKSPFVKPSIGSLVKPGTGFGAFVQFDEKSPFAKPSAFTAQQPTATFGANALQSKPDSTPSTSSFGTPSSFGTGPSVFGKVAPTSTFGQSSFGQFQTGASVFGKPSFEAVSNAPPPATPPTSTSTSGAFSVFASGTQSAFGMAASKNTSAKPAWVTNDSSKSLESNPIGAVSNVFGKSTMASQFTPRDVIASDDDSRSPSPAPVQRKETPSIPSSSAPSPPASAFSNLQTTPVFVKAAPSSMAPRASSAQPTFGAPSMAGGAFKSAFPPMTTTPVQPPPASSSGAFSAFSSSGGGFAAFALGGGKSFSDLLRSSGEDKSPGAEPSEATPTKPPQPPSQATVSTAPVSTPAKEPPEPPSTPPVTPKVEKEEPKTVEAKTIEVLVESNVEEEGEVEERGTSEVEHTDAESILSDVPSESVSEEEESEAASEAADEEGSGVASEAVDEEEIEEQVEKGPEPSEVPLPVTPAYTRSPSTTPKVELPRVTASVSPSPQTPSVPSVPRVSPVRELGTTPPDSPARDTPPTPAQAQVPPFKASPPPSSPFGLPTRSNNRPIRSSPLANTPLVVDGEVPAPRETSAPKTFTPNIFTPTPTTAPASAPSVFASVHKVTTTTMAPTTTPGPSSLFTLTPPIPSIVPSPSPTPSLPKIPAPAPTPEQGMQVECLFLVTTLRKELENLKLLATETSVRTAELQKTSGVSHQKADLGDPNKWAFGDIEEYGRVLVDVQVDVKELKLERVSLRKVLKELDSNMLKVNTRKEEIARFNKAKTDAEYAKMLKIRTLAPEYSETQSQLRKSIRTIKDRVQKLEDHLQASKKRINELRTGRPIIRPPSLDTVNRTFRNIDIAIDQQKQEVSQLRHRMAKLEISGGVGTRDQLVVSSWKRPLNVTPNVAITTAAALNAERSARRLKKALLASRTQPLLNTTATASPLLTSFQTPQKGSMVKSDVKPTDAKTPEGVFSLPTTPMSFLPSLPDWTPPPPSEFGSPVTHDISPSRNRGGIKYHQKPIVLKKNASPAGTTAQPSPFEWKPLEPIRPVSSLPFALRPAGSG